MLAYGHKIGPREIRLYQRYGEALNGYGPNERLRITIDKDRHGKFNSLFHVMLDLLAKAINRGPATTSVDALKKWVKLRKGWYEVIPLPQPAPDGTTHAVEYRPTSFKSMGEAEFHAFAMDACELICAELAPWLASAPEWAEARQIVNSILPEDAA